jgi:hypothetical protein
MMTTTIEEIGRLPGYIVTVYRGTACASRQRFPCRFTVIGGDPVANPGEIERAYAAARDYATAAKADRARFSVTVEMGGVVAAHKTTAAGVAEASENILKQLGDEVKILSVVDVTSET